MTPDGQPGAIGWDDADTARFYEAFQRTHRRYQDANECLVAQAHLQGGQSVLDAAAGSGLTAEAAMAYLGRAGSIICFEPAKAMRAAGRRRVHGPAVTWVRRCPQPPKQFNRILCGAAIWQMQPLPGTLRRLAALLAPGGCLAFNIPSLYLGHPETPGGGQDPLLLQLPAVLADGRTGATPPAPPVRLPGAADIDAMLVAAGLRPERWSACRRFTQAEYRDWLKIPVLTNYLLPGCDADERARRIDAAYAKVDAESWKWESWSGWTAWAPD